jgi:hypothetical protein
MSDKQPIGRKYDQGKTLSGTVLAGFWRVAGRDALTEALSNSRNSGLDRDTVEALVDVLDEFFDVDLTIPERVYGACEQLTLYVSPQLYLRGAIEVGSYGARKYARDNWLHVEDGINRYYEAVGRHVEDLICGHWYDDDKEGPDGETVEGSHLPNLSHIFWGILAAGELLNRTRDAEALTCQGPYYQGQDMIGDPGPWEAQAIAGQDTPKPDAPKLVLPLEVGKTYRLTTPWGDADPDDSGEHVARDAMSDGDGAIIVRIGGWWFDVKTGRFRGGSDAQCLRNYVEGPVSE